MHTAGWVHRDVSIGNILIDETGHGRLVDLEYAKRMGDDSIPESRVVSSFYRFFRRGYLKPAFAVGYNTVHSKRSRGTKVYM